MWILQENKFFPALSSWPNPWRDLQENHVQLIFFPVFTAAIFKISSHFSLLFLKCLLLLMGLQRRYDVMQYSQHYYDSRIWMQVVQENYAQHTLDLLLIRSRCIGQVLQLFRLMALKVLRRKSCIYKVNNSEHYKSVINYFRKACFNTHIKAIKSFWWKSWARSSRTYKSGSESGEFYYVSFYLLRNLNIGIDKFAFNAESIGDKLEIYIFKLMENGKAVSH